jgi:thiol-disulfide isomerase/thioredoxin
MIAKQILRSVLLIVVLGSLAIWANREFRKSKSYGEVEIQPAPAETLPVMDGPQVVMTYFLIGTRCASCRKIEALARETAEKDFPAELASNKLIFRVIDTDEAANRHYLDDYKLSSKTVVISRRLGGRETTWKNMEKVWDLLDDPPAYHAYLGERIREYLGS